MLPIGLLPYPPFDMTFLMTILKGAFFLNPANLLFAAVIFIVFFSLKTMTAKLAFLGGTLALTSIAGYILHKKEKQKAVKVKNKKIGLSDDFFENEEISEQKQQEQELMLSRIFKK